MGISVEMVKNLREQTGAGVLDCRNALEEAKGDREKALQLLRKKGLAIAARKADRQAEEGLVEAYIHAGGKLGVLLELDCETDFVARTEDFQDLAHDLAMQVAATNPQYVAAEDIPPEVLERERQRQRGQIDEDKPEEVIKKIVEGKLGKYREEVCLLAQPFIKDEGLTVQDLIASKIAKLGENIRVRRFSRFEVGASLDPPSSGA